MAADANYRTATEILADVTHVSDTDRLVPWQWQAARDAAATALRALLALSAPEGTV